MNTGLTVSQRAEQRYQEGSDLTSDIITMIYEDVAETLRLTAPPSLVAGLLVTGLLSCIILAWGRSRLTVGRAVSLFLPENVPALLLSFLLMPAICISLAYGASVVMRRFLPGVYRILSGGR